MTMNLMECEGCGFAFSTQRGATGNFYLGGELGWWMNHECAYCKTVTHVGHGTVQVVKPQRRRLAGVR